MIEFKTILVPVDFSEPSKRAVVYGMTLAAQLHARLLLVHVVPDLAAMIYAFPAETGEIEDQQFKEAEKKIQDLIPAKYLTQCDVQRMVKIGNVDATLLDIVNKQSVDLVVMGTHGRGYVGRWFLGSTTEAMLRKLPVPVLTISHIAPEAHSIELGLVALKHILYATNFSESAADGMKYAIELARRTGAHLTVAHVLEHVDYIWAAASMVSYLDEQRQKLVRDLRLKLSEFIAREKPRDTKVEGLILDGKPFERILDTAEKRGMDLIVMNLQSKGTLERAFIGSTAERVVRLAKVPVLSVPHWHAGCN